MKRLPTLRPAGRPFALRPAGRLLTLGLSLLIGAGFGAGFSASLSAAARPVIIGGAATSPVIETKRLSGEREGLPVWFLPRLGIQTRNNSQDLWLNLGSRSLRYTPQGGWQASGFSLARPLPKPERYGEGGSLHVTLEVLRALGLALSGSDSALKVAARRVAVEVPEPVSPQVSVVEQASAARPASRASTSQATSRPAPPARRPAVKLAPARTAASATTTSKAPPGAPALAGVERAAPLPGLGVLTPPRKGAAQSSVRSAPAQTAAVAAQTSTAQTSTAQTSTARPSTVQSRPTQTRPTQTRPATPVQGTPAPASSSSPSTARPRPTPSPLAQISPAQIRPAQVNSVQADPAPTTPAPVVPAPSEPSQPAPVPTPVPAPPAPPVPAPPTPLPALSGPRITGVRSSLSSVRSVQLQRLVIDLSAPGGYSAQSERGGVTVFLPGATAAAEVQTLESGDTLTLAPDLRGVTVRLDTVRLGSGGGQSTVTALTEPDRLVIDTASSLSFDVPPPIKEDALPAGVSLRTLGGLSLLSFDPARFVPRVMPAPTGSALSVAELVRRSGGVAGVNGGYFDPPSSLPVDFVAANGLMLAASLERRGTVGFTETGEALFGFPRPRYTLSGTFGSLNVNTISARSNPGLLTAFIGDGRTAVGGSNLTTLTLNTAASSVLRADSGVTVPASGLISLSFDPARFPQLPRTPGGELSATLNYQLEPWQGVREGLSAGPMLLRGGAVVLDPAREAFNVLSGVWRPTRQVAFAIYKGQPTLAFLEFGTPDSFARALHSAGVQDALRLDSGSSATVFVTGGYLGTGGYLNSVWSRPVPNAIVLVPVEGTRAVRANEGR